MATVLIVVAMVAITKVAMVATAEVVRFVFIHLLIDPQQVQPQEQLLAFIMAMAAIAAMVIVMAMVIIMAALLALALPVVSVHPF